ncbi:MAG: ArsB/NhaD family transporter, partial [Chitinophagaceae bacterium]
PRYILPSLVSIAITFRLLKYMQRKNLKGIIPADVVTPVLSPGGITAAAGIIGTALVLLIYSANDLRLGLPTAIAGIVSTAIVSIIGKKNPWVVAKKISWSIIPLVAALFVIVEGLNKTGLIGQLAALLQRNAGASVATTAMYSGLIVGFASNLTNNLPAGLIAAQVLHSASPAEEIRSAILLGMDLGPNLSITGSLATILWLVALRREGIEVSAWDFLKLGMLIMTCSLMAALAVLLI